MVSVIKQYNSFRELLNDLLSLSKRLLDEKAKVKTLIDSYRDKALAEERFASLLKDIVKQNVFDNNSLNLGKTKLYLTPNMITRYKLLNKYYEDLGKRYENLSFLIKVIERFSSVSVNAKITVVYEDSYPTNIIVDF